MQETKRKPSSSKSRPYNKSFKWTFELHLAFEKAVKKLGAKAKPSQILKEMNVPSLKREQVSSHLQKYRGYQKSTRVPATMQLVFEDQTKSILLHCNNKNNQEAINNAEKKAKERSTSTTPVTLTTSTQAVPTTSSPHDEIRQEEEHPSTQTNPTPVEEPSHKKVGTINANTTDVSLPHVNMVTDQPSSSYYSNLLFPPFDVNSAEFQSSMEELVNIIFCQQPHLCL